VDAFVQPGRKVNETAAPAKIKVDFPSALFVCLPFIKTKKEDVYRF